MRLIETQFFWFPNERRRRSADQASVLPRQGLGEDAAEQLEGVPGLRAGERDAGACGGSVRALSDRLRSLRGVLDQGSYTLQPLALAPSLQPLTSLITSTVTLAALFVCNVDI